jgi:hypothetical protein
MPIFWLFPCSPVQLIHILKTLDGRLKLRFLMRVLLRKSSRCAQSSLCVAKSVLNISFALKALTLVHYCLLRGSNEFVERSDYESNFHNLQGPSQFLSKQPRQAYCYSLGRSLSIKEGERPRYVGDPVPVVIFIPNWAFSHWKLFHALRSYPIR